jgi:hypothetical protein
MFRSIRAYFANLKSKRDMVKACDHEFSLKFQERYWHFRLCSTANTVMPETNAGRLHACSKCGLVNSDTTHPNYEKWGEPVDWNDERERLLLQELKKLHARTSPLPWWR